MTRQARELLDPVLCYCDLKVHCVAPRTVSLLRRQLWKRSILGILATAALMLAASCAEDEIVQPSNPTPELTDLQPDSAAVGGEAFTLEIRGAGFMSSSSLLWNSVARPTRHVDAQTMQIDVAAADLSSSSTVGIRAYNPTPGGGFSNVLEFRIVASPEAPWIASLSPSMASRGDSSLAVTVNGGGFVESSVVYWGDEPRTTSFVRETRLTALLSTSDLQTPGRTQITVRNPVGGRSNAMPFDVVDPNPVPEIVSLDPSSLVAGGASFLLRVQGAAFTQASVVLWGGMSRPTQYVSSTLLEASISASDIASPSAVSVSVFTPSPGGGNSTPITFVVANAVPGVAYLFPMTGRSGRQFELTVYGGLFVQQSVVRWNGADRVTRFVNSTQLVATIRADDVPNAGVADVTVYTPPPGGGTSVDTLQFVAYMRLELPTGDLIYDSSRERLYASVRAGGGSHANSIATIDPQVGVESSLYVGAEPGTLALSDDAQFLYVGLNTGHIRRLDLTAQTMPLDIGTSLAAKDIEVLPGASHSIAVVKDDASSSASFAGLVVYDDQIPRPRAFNETCGPTYIEFGATSATLYSIENTYLCGLKTFELSSTGVTLIETNTALVPSYVRLDFVFEAGLLYTSFGDVIDPLADRVVGSFDAYGPLCADAAVGRVYYLEQQYPSTIRCRAFDMNTYAGLASMEIPGAPGNVGSLVRWGEAGLVFRSEDSVFIIRAPWVNPAGNATMIEETPKESSP